MQQKPPDPPGASLSSAAAPGQDRETALALSGEEAFARRAMYALFFTTKSIQLQDIAHWCLMVCFV